MNRPTRFPRPAVMVRDVLRGAHPVAVWRSAATDAMYGRALAGHNGAIRIGEPSSPSRKYSGELGPHQFYRGAAPLAAFKPMKGENRALPNTHGPVTTPNPVVDLLARVAPQGGG